MNTNLRKYNKFITSVLKDTDLVPAINCYLENNIGKFNCTVMKNVHLDMESGVVLGYLKLHTIGNESDIIVFSTICDNFDEDTTPQTKDLSNIIYHTYANTNKKSTLKLKVKEFTFYNVVLNRFKSYRDTYRFFAKASISDIEQLQKILNKGGKNGEGNTRTLSKRN